jgi:hypothetical protein
MSVIDLTASSSQQWPPGEIDLTASSIASQQVTNGAVAGGERASSNDVDTDDEVMVVGEKTLETRLLEGAKGAIDLVDSQVQHGI